MMSFTITFDATETPTYEDLLKFKVKKMSVLVSGPGGGNPLLVMTFSSRDDARVFGRGWYDNGDRSVMSVTGPDGEDGSPVEEWLNQSEAKSGISFKHD